MKNEQSRPRSTRDNSAGWAATIGFAAILWATFLGILGSVFGQSDKPTHYNSRGLASRENLARYLSGELETTSGGRSAPDAGVVGIQTSTPYSNNKCVSE